jgi:excisionase family DNA binding protein
MDIADAPDMMRVEEAAAVLRVSRNLAYDAIAEFFRTEGQSGLPAIRLGRVLRVPKSTLLEWVQTETKRALER